MKYIKHIILTAFAMVMMMTGTWAMDIYIHYENGTWPTGISSSDFNDAGDLIIDVEPTDVMGAVKTKIQEKTGFVVSGMQLSFGNHSNLDDNNSFAGYNIQKLSTLTLQYTAPIDPFVPVKQANGTWQFTMPDANKLMEVEYYNTYTLTVASNDAQMGSAAIATPLPAGVTDNGNGNYTVIEGTEVTLNATANTGYSFAGWNDQNTDNPRTVKVTSDMSLTANFAIGYRLDSLSTTWEVYLNNATTPIYPTAYSTNNTMGYVMIPMGANVVINPQPTEQTELVSRLGIKLAGVLDGIFSVSGTKQVQFSQGNLQATTSDKGTNWSWSFATNQWDYVGNNVANTSLNGNGKVSTNGAVDLFGWSTSATYYGINNSTNNGTYSGNFANWGTLAIGNGGGVANLGWSTLSRDEWVYVFNTRASGSTVNGVSNARYTHATINTDGTSMNGMILFPDGITIANSEATSWGTVNGGSTWDNATKCTIAQWMALAAKGCVFMPSAGARDGVSVANMVTDGAYWSSTPYNAQRSYLANFYSAGLNMQAQYGRYHGYSVRLVKVHTVTTNPVRCGTDNNSWCFQMPTGNHVLRTYWKQPCGVAYAQADLVQTAYLNFPFTAPALDNPNNLIVTYSVVDNNGLPMSADDAPFAVDATTGEVTFIKAGTARVVATAVGTDEYLGCEAFYTLTVNNPGILTLASNDPAMGSVVIVTPLPAGVTDNGNGTYSVLEGTEVTLNATANTGYSFAGWNDQNTDNPRTITVTSDTTFTAIFGLPDPGLTNPGLTPEGEITLQGGRFVNEHGQIVGQPRVTEHGEFIDYSGGATATVPDGAINGKFTINADGNQVYFSQGNLQASNNTANSATGWIWSFAEHQYDYIGNNGANDRINGAMTISEAGIIDLFSWNGNSSTSGDHYGIFSMDNNSYFGNMHPETLKNDWGHNAISNGGNTADMWRTLTKDEWVYVFNNRNTASGVRYARANVNGCKGVILLPDDWNTSYYTLNNTNQEPTNYSADNYSANTISLSDWENSLESHGAVFLPAAGSRAYGNANSIILSSFNSAGNYWSSSSYSSDRTYSVYFSNTDSQLSKNSYRKPGFSVRLVMDVE